MSSKGDDSWRNKAKQLLTLLQKEDLYSLASTITARKKFSSESDAVDGILSGCRAPNELLGKRKIKHEYLLRYLWEENIAVTSKSSKTDLCIKVLNLWNCLGDSDGPTIEEVMEDEEADVVQQASVSLPQPSAVSFQYVNSSIAPTQQQQAQVVDRSTEDMVLSACFLRWFYELLTVNGHNFGPQHFFDNATMKLCCGVDPNLLIKDIIGSADVVHCFVQLIDAEHLLFNANLTPSTGFSTIREPHGALLIKNCGVVHRESLIIGPYDIYFVVLQDPFNQTWKIQRVSLIIKAPVNQMVQ